MLNKKISTNHSVGKPTFFQWSFLIMKLCIKKKEDMTLEILGKERSFRAVVHEEGRGTPNITS